MSILSRAVLAAALIAGTAFPAFAWSVLEGWRDPIGGRTHTAVGMTNDAGVSVVMFREEDQVVRAVFSLPPSSFDRLSRTGRVLALRADDQPSLDVIAVTTPDLILEEARSDTRNVRLVIWYSLSPAPTVGLFRELLDGDTLYARFFTDSGGTVDTSWPLEGARQAIADTLDVNVYASPEDIEWARLSGELMISAEQRCNRNTECSLALSPCIFMLKTRDDIDSFNQCVEGVIP